ncbi:MAG: hypothetical protein R8F63_06895 [Acidimicrobiales bacterium]|nr:hypothetical protein [Acidimicrobiales bacterium]
MWGDPALDDPATVDARLRVLRILVALYAAVWTIVRTPHLLDALDFAERRFDPVGPLAFLGAPVPALVLVAVIVATPVAAIAFAFDRGSSWTGPLAALGFLFVTTYRNSWGQLFHTENLAALHLVVLAVVVRARGDRRWAIDALAVLTVGTYLVAGIAKLRISGTAWLDGDVLRHQVAFDNARKELLGDVSSPFAGWLLRRDWLLAPAAMLAMVVEIAAPLALLRARIARGWCALAFGFHVAILAFMAILFPYHLLGIALAPLLPVERVGATVSPWLPRFRRRSTTSLPIG